MATLTATASVDMTDWNFNNIKTGSIEQHTSTRYAVAGAAGGLHYEFIGSGLTYDGSNLMTGGIVTSYRVLDGSGTTLLSVTGFSIGAAAVETAIQNGDSGGSFESTVFANGNTITGSASDDLLQAFSSASEIISGGDGNDRIIDFTVGNSDLLSDDQISGGNGDDTVYLGGNWQGNSVDGGDGFDTVVFSGDYPVHFFVAAYFANVENFVLLQGPSYTFSFSGIAAPGQTVTFDAYNLGASAKVQLDGSQETDGSFVFLGSAGTDILRGGSNGDVFWLDKGGKDKVYGGDGNDTFLFGATLNNTDRVRGNAGSDTLKLDGTYNIVFADNTIGGIENLNLAGGHNYTITLAEGNVDNGGSLFVDAIALGAANQLVFDASALTDGAVGIVDGAGNDTLTGGAGDDSFAMSRGGQNIINAGGGDDTITYQSNNFTALEQVNGGAGNDTLTLYGDYSAGLTLGATTISGIEKLAVGDGYDYDLTLVDGNVASGATLVVDGSTLTADFSLRIDGSAELDGKFIMTGGAGKDTLIGGARTDTLTGGAGADVLTGGAQTDTFVFTGADDSTGKRYDVITDFNGTNEFIDVVNAVTGRDADITSGTLSRASFDTDLAAKVDAAHLLAGHAVFFKASAGTLNGHTFLVIDQNGTAGYQSGADLVIDVTGITHQVDVTAATFI